MQAASGGAGAMPATSSEPTYKKIDPSLSPEKRLSAIDASITMGDFFKASNAFYKAEATKDVNAMKAAYKAYEEVYQDIVNNLKAAVTKNPKLLAQAKSILKVIQKDRSIKLDLVFAELKLDGWREDYYKLRNMLLNAQKCHSLIIEFMHNDNSFLTAIDLVEYADWSQIKDDSFIRELNQALSDTLVNLRAKVAACEKSYKPVLAVVSNYQQALKEVKKCANLLLLFAENLLEAGYSPYSWHPAKKLWALFHIAHQLTEAMSGVIEGEVKEMLAVLATFKTDLTGVRAKLQAFRGLQAGEVPLARIVDPEAAPPQTPAGQRGLPTAASRLSLVSPGARSAAGTPSHHDRTLSSHASFFAPDGTPIV